MVRKWIFLSFSVENLNHLPSWFLSTFADWTLLYSYSALVFFVCFTPPCPPLLVLFQHTNTHANKAAEAATRELIWADRPQWHPWHFREKACRFKAPRGCVVRILQTDESLREWTTEGYSGEAGGEWSQDIYLVRCANRICYFSCCKTM